MLTNTSPLRKSKKWAFGKQAARVICGRFTNDRTAFLRRKILTLHHFLWLSIIAATAGENYAIQGFFYIEKFILLVKCPLSIHPAKMEDGVNS